MHKENLVTNLEHPFIFTSLSMAITVFFLSLSSILRVSIRQLMYFCGKQNPNPPKREA